MKFRILERVNNSGRIRYKPQYKKFGIWVTVPFFCFAYRSLSRFHSMRYRDCITKDCAIERINDFKEYISNKKKGVNIINV